MKGPRSASGILDYVLVGLAAVAVGVAVLSYANRPSQPPLPTGPRIGSVLGRISTVSSNGTTEAVSAAGPTPFTVILGFSPECPYCEANAPRWSELVGRLPNGVHVVAVSDGVRERAQSWLDHHSVKVDRLLIPWEARELAQWGIVATPTTIVVDQGSRVVFAHMGVLQPGDVAEVVRDATR